jgi:CBS domain-containing protein
MIPVALASATAAAARRYVIGMGPLFPVPAHPLFIGPGGLVGCAVVGIAAGALSALLTLAVYAAEDAFKRLPIHWMWWPAIGGLVVGLGGLVFPEALGVGYDTIGALLQGDVPARVLIGVLVVKSIIWSVSLGSGTSGGVLAPLLLMGGALGGVASLVLPSEGSGFWSLIGMGAILGGTMRSPFTGVVFALELTHDVNAMLPLLVAVTLAHGFTVLALRRSILTEKVSRRGYHLSREYAIDPLEILFVREVMRANVTALTPDTTPDAVAALLGGDGLRRRQLLYPVVDGAERLVGVVTRSDMETFVDEHRHGGATRTFADLVNDEPNVAYPDEPLRAVAYRMAETGLTRFPVVERGGRRLVGMIGLFDLLQGRLRNLEAERRRDRVIPLRLVVPRALARRARASAG